MKDDTYIKEIIEAKLIVLTGAGASLHFGYPLMNSILVNQLKLHIGKDNEDYGRIIDAICESLRVKAKKGKYKNLELIYDALETFNQADWLKDFRFRDDLPPALTEKGKRIFERVEKLKERVREFIFAKYGPLREGTQKTYLLAAYDELFDVLFKKVGKAGIIPVFSTNYDWSIEQYCDEDEKYILNTGFSSDHLRRKWSKAQYEDIRSDKATIVLFKLHGSTHWVKEKEKIISYPPSPSQSGHEPQNPVMLYPARGKLTVEDPFFTAHNYLKQCLKSGPTCIVIGYSFSDIGIITQVKSAMEEGAKPRFIIVDPKWHSIIGHTESAYKIRLGASGIEYKFGHPREGRKASAELARELGVPSYSRSSRRGVRMGLLLFEPNMIIVPHSPLLQPENLTIEAWIRPLKSGDENARIIRKARHNQAGYILAFRQAGYTSIQFRLDIRPGFRIPAVGDDYKKYIGKWIHVAGTYNAKNKEVCLYIDGKLSGRAVNKEAMIPQNRDVLTIGSSPHTSGENFYGYIRDVRISSEAIYKSNFQPSDNLTKEKHTVLLLKLNEGKGLFAADSSGNKLHGKIDKDTWVAYEG